MTKISMQLPFFPGFYESALLNSDTAYYAIKEELDYLQDEVDENLCEDDLDFNYDEYQKDVSNAFVEVFGNLAPSDVVENVEFDEIVSPRYYNYQTDRLFAFVTLKDGWKDAMRSFIDKNAEWLADRIKKDWTSYDGFMSFMDNKLNDWCDRLFGNADEDIDGRYIGSMIGYMMWYENPQIHDELIMDTLEDIYAGSYVYVTDEAKKRLNIND